MLIREMISTERPRERLLKYGGNVLSDAEVLAIIFRTGLPGKNVVSLAQELLTQFGGIHRLLDADQKQLCKHRGVGLAKYAQLKASFELAQRYLHAKMEDRKTLDNSILTKNFFQSKLRDKKQEIFAAAFLDIKQRLIHYEELFYGTISQANIYPREIIKRALYHNAAAVIFAHNHPSGVAEASASDIKLTHELLSTLAIIDVKVLDHLIIGDNVILSMYEEKLL